MHLLGPGFHQATVIGQTGTDLHWFYDVHIIKNIVEQKFIIRTFSRQYIDIR